jgi:predicted negative regulator of RcsB-dependent stress response
MAVYDLEEQQKIDELKSWWSQYGTWVTGAIIAICLVVIGVQGWRWYQRTQGEEAGALYGAVSQAVERQDAAKAKDAAAQLATKHGGTGYAPRAALLLAKLLFDANDKAGAKAQLQWVIDRAGEEELRELARYRLAQVLFDEKAFDEAMRTLDARHSAAMAPLYSDLRGDLLLAAGKQADARAAYQAALDKLGATSSIRVLVQAKLDSLGGAQ